MCCNRAGVKVDFILSEEDKEAFVTQVAQDLDTFKSVIQDIEMKSSRTWLPTDRVMLFDAVERSVKFSGCNYMVHSAIREWVILQLEALIQTAEEANRIHYGFTLALLQHEQVSPQDLDPYDELESPHSKPDQRTSQRKSMSIRLSNGVTGMTKIFTGRRQSSVLFTELPEDEDAVNVFPNNGVRMSGIYEFVAASGGWGVLTGLSVEEVSTRCVAPLTAETRSSYCEMLRWNHSKGVAPANVFVSYSWKYKFAEVVKLLEERFGDKSSAVANGGQNGLNLSHGDHVLWCSLFSLNPHQAHQLELKWFCKHFEQVMQSMWLTAIVLLDWDTPIPMRSLFEIYFAVESGSPFEILMDYQKKYDFLFVIATNPSVMNYLLINIYIEEALLIELGETQSSEGVFDRKRFTRVVKEGIFNAMTSHFEKNLADYDYTEQIRITDALALLYQRAGILDKAEALYVKCLKKKRETLRLDEPSVLSSIHTLVNMYRESGQIKKAVSLEEQSGLRPPSIELHRTIDRSSSSDAASMRECTEHTPPPSETSVPLKDLEVRGTVSPLVAMRRLSRKIIKLFQRNDKQRLYVEERAPFPLDGLLISALEDFVAASGGWGVLTGLSVEEVSTRCVAPLTAETRSSYCEMLRWNHSKGVAPANVFVSVNAKYSFEDVVNKLKNELGGVGYDSLVLWCNLFSISLHDSVYSDIKWYCQHFEHSMRNMQLTVLILLDINTPIPLRNLFEIYSAIDSGSPFEIVMNHQLKYEFLLAVGTDVRTMNQLLSSIFPDENADEDTLQIYQYITSRQNQQSFASTLQKGILHWLMHTMESTLNSYKRDEQTVMTSILGSLFVKEGQLERAESMCLESLRRKRASLDADHIEVMQALVALADLYRTSRSYESARALYIELLEKRERLFGADDRVTIDTLHSLAAVTWHINHTQALELYNDCFDKCKRVFGSDHDKTLMVMEELAEAYAARQMYSLSEDLYAVIFEKRRTILGIDHQDTLTVMNTLGELYFKQELYEKAEYFYEIVLEKREKLLGVDHPDTIITANSLAELFYKLKDYDKAKNLYAIALEKMKQLYGPDHSKTLASMMRLAEVYTKQGDLATAEVLYTYCVKTRKAQGGADSFDTEEALLRLADVHSQQNEFDKAENSYKLILKSRKDSLGIDHADTLSLMYKLADMYVAQNQLTKAEALYGDYWNNLKNLSANNASSLSSMTILADLYLKRGIYDKAEVFHTLVLEKRRQYLGNEHMDTIQSMYHLANVYHKKNYNDKAEALYLECFEKRCSILGLQHEATLTLITCLASFYQDQSKYEEAEKFYDLQYKAKPLQI